MRILLTSSEVAPFSKTGGLGDVGGSLASALARRGHRVLTVSPGYRSTRWAEAGFSPLPEEVVFPLGGAIRRVRFAHRQQEGVDHLLVLHPWYDRDGLYGDQHGSFGDNHLRFALLSRAALEAARGVNLSDGEPLGEEVIVHGHDWQTALAPVYLEALYRPLGLFRRSGSVLTVHNAMHQGRLPANLFGDLELAPRWFGPASLEWYGDLGLLKGGLLAADALTTVSPTFARDLLTPEGSFGLDGPFRHRAADLTGILNGIDTKEWDPRQDPHLAQGFDEQDLSGKELVKREVQAELGLEVGPSPLVVWIGRLDPQKGVNLLLESLPWLLREGAQVVVLGSAAAAHQAFESALRQAQAQGGAFRALLGFSERWAHRLTAAGDLLVMPSLFEPCGLNQMYASRYGTLPIVRRTGGLADSVTPLSADRQTGTGFLFDAPDGHAFRTALWQALDVYRRDPSGFHQARLRGMRVDFGWDNAVTAYEAVYERAMRLGPSRYR